MSEKILLFEMPPQESAKIKRLASQMRIRTKIVNVSEYGKTIGQIAETDEIKNDAADSTAGFRPADSLIVMCGLTEKHMDRLLFSLRRDNIRAGYKAILTPSNSTWSVSKMYAHMELEHKLTH